ALISRPQIKDILLEMGAELRMGIDDFSEERAANIRLLNEVGIPVYAWIRAPKAQSFTFRIDNASTLLKRYQSFKSWSDSHDLKWAGIGIDLRPAPEELQQWAEQPMLSAWNAYLNLFEQEELQLALPLFREFKEAVHKDGYVLESYVLPFSLDENPEEAKALQYMGQILNVETDRIIPLCHTNMPYVYPASILDYGARARRVGLGSTSNESFDGLMTQDALDWESLSRDLRLAHDVCQEIHLSSLESIAANGWLEALADFDFSVPVFLYSKELEDQETQAFVSQQAFKALSYPVLSTAALIILTILSILFSFFFIRFLFSWKKKNATSQQEEIDYEIISG
ncbi:MAG: hypothetical protein AAGD28_12200, partial [Bacteroidota bacterium]